MRPEEFLAYIEERLAHHAMVCQLAGHEVRDEDGAMILHHPYGSEDTLREVAAGVRVGSTFVNGEPYHIYSYTVAECEALHDEVAEILSTPVSPNTRSDHEQERSNEGTRTTGAN